MRYFQNRTGDNLYLAKEAERKVDAALRELERDLGDQKLMSF